jgi:hypothetical protein
MASNFTALGNFQRGYLDRVLGRKGIKSTAQRIEKMLTNTSGEFYPISSISFIKFRQEIWELASGRKVEGEKELIKRLLQELEVRIWNDLDENRQSELLKEFEK